MTSARFCYSPFAVLVFALKGTRVFYVPCVSCCTCPCSIVYKVLFISSCGACPCFDFLCCGKVSCLDLEGSEVWHLLIILGQDILVPFFSWEVFQGLHCCVDLAFRQLLYLITRQESNSVTLIPTYLALQMHFFFIFAPADFFHHLSPCPSTFFVLLSTPCNCIGLGSTVHSYVKCNSLPFTCKLDSAWNLVPNRMLCPYVQCEVLLVLLKIECCHEPTIMPFF